VRSILVHADASASTENRVQTAMTIARRTRGHVTLNVNTPMGRYVAMDPFGGMYPMEAAMAQAQQAEDELVAKLKAHLARDDVPFSITTTSDDMADALLDAGILADLIVMPLDARGSRSRMMASVTGAVAVAAGSAVLAIPDDATPNLEGKAVIAWNGSIESANAVRRAVPLLAGAASVHVITFGKPTDFPATDVLDYLSRQDIHAELHEHPKEIVVEEAIERVGDAMGADWLVMGAYGHNRIRETLFGGVTRYMLDSAHFTLFLAH